jgi:hypothetical protein
LEEDITKRLRTEECEAVCRKMKLKNDSTQNRNKTTGIAEQL